MRTVRELITTSSFIDDTTLILIRNNRHKVIAQGTWNKEDILACGVYQVTSLYVNFKGNIVYINTAA